MCFALTPCPHTLSPHLVSTPCLNTLSPHLVPTPCPHTLSQHLVSTPCLNTLSPHLVSTPCRLVRDTPSRSAKICENLRLNFFAASRLRLSCPCCLRQSFRQSGVSRLFQLPTATAAAPRGGGPTEPSRLCDSTILNRTLPARSPAGTGSSQNHSRPGGGSAPPAAPAAGTGARPARIRRAPLRRQPRRSASRWSGAC